MHPSPTTRVFFHVLTLGVTGAAHGLLVLWLLTTFPRLRPRRAWLVAAAVFLTLLVPVARWIALASKDDGATTLFACVTTEMLLAVFIGFPLGLVRIASWIAARRAKKGQDAQQAVIARRAAIERVVGAVAIPSMTLAFGWGITRGRHEFALEEVAVRIPGLPRALDGYTIAQVSDIHVGAFVGERELSEGLSLVDKIRPDLIVATGDLVDFDPRRGPFLARRLADLASRDGVIAIVGNHDYYAGVNEVIAAMRAAGVDVLLNAGRTIRATDGGGFAILGVDDLWARRSGGAGPSLERAMAMVRPDAPRVLLSHQPAYFDVAAGQVALQLSGHMHGGQVNPLGLRLADLVARYVAGRYERSGSTLWVNRGFGVAGPPVRLGAPPEVTKIVLVAA